MNTFRLTDETEVLLSSSCPLVMKNKWVKNTGSKYMSYWKRQPLCQRTCTVKLIAALNALVLFFFIPLLVLMNFDNKKLKFNYQNGNPRFSGVSSGLLFLE